MSWRPARALITLLDQVNAAYPNRSKADDGIIGDAAHASRASDHNPNDAGVVCAIDLTDEHGGAGKFEAASLIPALMADERVHYCIHDDIFYHRGRGAEPYHGSSPHTGHIHVSLVQDASLYDRTEPFPWPKGAIIVGEWTGSYVIVECGHPDHVENLRAFCGYDPGDVKPRRGPWLALIDLAGEEYAKAVHASDAKADGLIGWCKGRGLHGTRLPISRNGFNTVTRF